MQLSVTFKNLDSSENLKSYAKEKLERLDKYLHNPAEANVMLTVEKFRHIAEVNIIGDKLNINGKEETGDMYSAIDVVVDKLEKQIKKNKQKIRDRRSAAKAKAKEIMEEEDIDDFEDGLIPGLITSVENIEYKPMYIEEAAEQAGLVESNFFVFINAETGRVNVLYKLKDGTFGLIQPSN